jgi:hypothetical protein
LKPVRCTFVTLEWDICRFKRFKPKAPYEDLTREIYAASKGRDVAGCIIFSGNPKHSLVPFARLRILVHLELGPDIKGGL